MSQAPTVGFGCAICSDTFDVNVARNICTIPQCGHVYHEYCIKRWFRTQLRQGRPSNCPKCRIPAIENQIIRLFLHEIISSDSNAADETDEDVYDVNENDSDDDLATTEEISFADDLDDFGIDDTLPPLIPIDMPRLVPIHEQTNSNDPGNGLNSQQWHASFAFDESDVHFPAPFNQW